MTISSGSIGPRVNIIIIDTHNSRIIPWLTEVCRGLKKCGQEAICQSGVEKSAKRRSFVILAFQLFYLNILVPSAIYISTKYRRCAAYIAFTYRSANQTVGTRWYFWSLDEYPQDFDLLNLESILYLHQFVYKNVLDGVWMESAGVSHPWFPWPSNISLSGTV